MSEQQSSPSSRDRVIDRKSDVTGRVSESCRVVGFGLLLVYFSIVLSDSSAAVDLRQVHAVPIYMAGMFGIFTVLSDYLQYVAGASAAKTALTRPDAKYDPHSLAYRAQQTFYIAKQWTAVFGALFVIYFMALPGGWQSVF